MVTVRELLRLRPGLVVRAGADELDREIRWPHVSELLDPTPYLSGGELLLCAGVHLPRRRTDVSAYAGRLADFGVAGLGFGIDPIHARVPEALVSACERVGLALLEVPPSIPFIAISEALATESEARHLADLRRLNAAQRALVNAATRPSATSAIVRRLAEQLHAGALLVEADHARRWAAGTPAPDEAALAAQITRVTSGSTDVGVAVHEADVHVVITAVHSEQRQAALVVARARPLSAAERGIVSVAASALTLLWRGLPRRTGVLLGAALAEAATGATSGGWEPALARALGVEAGAAWRVVACAPRRPARGEAARERRRERLRAALASPLLRTEGDVAIVLVPEAAEPATAAGAVAAQGELVGLSTARPWAEVALAVGEARRSLAAARISGRLTSADTTGSPETNGLGEVVDPERARDFAATVLDPVVRARPDGGAELLGTLRTWLEQHGGWDRTAAALGVHRNTVRNRIEAVGRLLQADLDDADVRWRLLFALRWLPPAPHAPAPAAPSAPTRPGSSGRAADRRATGRPSTTPPRPRRAGPSPAPR